ncbi:MAG: hypothetical protein V4465_00675 [Patescibacteria group bacterium]
MTEFARIAGLLAGITSFASFLLYYISIVRGKTIPNRATWFILTVVGTLICTSYYSLGARDTIWIPVSYVIGPLITFLLSIKYGEGGWTNFDRWCLFGSGVSLFFWWLFDSALLALLINILIDLFGMLPTLRKSYLRKESEEPFPWLITFLSCMLNILAIETWDFSIWIYPIYMLIINGAVFLLLYYPEKIRSLKLSLVPRV